MLQSVCVPGFNLPCPWSGRSVTPEELLSYT